MEPDEFFKMRNRARKEIYEEFSPRHEALEKELAALKEKYRWRVQGKENAPDWEYILYITKNKEVRMDVGRGLEDGERWMPLPDLPKEANP